MTFSNETQMIFAGVTAIIIAFLLSLYLLKRLRIIRALTNGVTVSPTLSHDVSATPLWVSCAALWLLLPSEVLTNDRFYSLQQALNIGKCVFVGGVFLAVIPSVLSIKLTINQRLMLRVAFELALSCVAVWQGIRFDVMSGTDGSWFLGGRWGSILSVAWIFGAMQAMKLLTGLGGAGLLLLLVTSLSLLLGTIGTQEQLLHALTLIVSGSVIGTLPFFFLRNGLELRGSAMSLTGYLFAVLTILARQKAATTVLVFVPLAAILIALAGLTIVLMDKGIRGRNQKPPNDETAK